LRTEPQSALALGGVPAETLAQAYGTPLLAIDTDVLDANIARFAELGTRYGLDVSYAGKALLFVAFARRLAASSLGLDVCSLGELLTAERAGFAAARLVLHGCGKTPAELAAAASGRVGRVVIDHFDELAQLAAASDPARPTSILLRINTGIEAHTHAHVRTGGEDSKFGFSRDDVAGAVAAALGAPGLRLVGFHSHLGSQIFEGSPYAASLPILLDAYEHARALGAPVTDLVLGGGFGIDSVPGAAAFDVAGAIAHLATETAAASRRAGMPAPRLGIEPGRAIVADAGTSLYRVVTVKYQGLRRFAIVDGGIADNPRPALYGAYHHPELAGRASSANPVTTVVCGRSCENDRLVEAALPSDLEAGDLVALRTTGAYTYSMASNYNRFTRPAIVFAGGGTHRLVVRRETEADVLRNDVDD
jgi:diaminopimelate decarboxylase